jgi:hypothetical protein
MEGNETITKLRASLPDVVVVSKSSAEIQFFRALDKPILSRQDFMNDPVFASQYNLSSQSSYNLPFLLELP